MWKVFNRNNIKILVDFAAILQIVSGVGVALSGIGYINFDHYDNDGVIAFVCGLLALATGGLLLYGIVKGHDKCILAYIIITTPVLLAANIFIFYVGILVYEQYKTNHSYPAYSIILLIHILLGTALAWIIQLFIYLFYKELKSCGRDTFVYKTIDQSGSY